MRRKRIRPAASVYGRGITRVRQISEGILKSALREGTRLKWMREEGGGSQF